MCFRLFGDPLEDGSQLDAAHLIKEASATSLAEAEYSTIYKGPNDAKGKTSSVDGHFAYRLVVTAEGCDGTSPDPLAANGFKVRSTGYVFAPLQFSWWGRDHQGPAVYGGDTQGDFGAVYDTEYDGIWDTFGIELGSTTTSVTFEEADADYLLDQDHPGQEFIANDIDYLIRDFETSSTLCTNTDPSGNIEIEKFICSFIAGQHQFLQWQWRKVLSTNMIHLWYSGSTLRMSTRPIKKLPVSSARSASEWLGADGTELVSLLPVVLGRLNACGQPIASSLTVATVADAKRILEGKAGLEYGGTHKLRDFRRELLALKLNVKHASQLGEPLEQGYVYGTSAVIGDVIDDSDDALAAHCHGDTCMSHCPGGVDVFPAEGNNLAAILALLPLVQAVNDGEVIYEPPPTLPPPGLP